MQLRVVGYPNTDSEESMTIVQTTLPLLKNQANEITTIYTPRHDHELQGEIAN